MRKFLEIAYNGKTFFGWQVQPDKRTVQGEINRAISTLQQEEINCVGCGRTDAGVHASQYFLHFDTQKEVHPDFVYKLNSILDDEIAVVKMIDIDGEEHARFSATERAYTYKVHFYKDPFIKDLSYNCFYKDLDRGAMQELAQYLTTLTDFHSLCKTDPDQPHTRCDVRSSEIIFSDDGRSMEYHIRSNRFLYNMIRRIVGLLITVGRWKLDLEEVKQVLSSNGTLSINFVAPPQGLYLSAVTYPFINR